MLNCLFPFSTYKSYGDLFDGYKYDKTARIKAKPYKIYGAVYALQKDEFSKKTNFSRFFLKHPPTRMKYKVIDFAHSKIEVIVNSLLQLVWTNF